MKTTSLSTALLAALPSASLARSIHPGHRSTDECSSINADEIRASGNNTLFTRWRPYSHVNAPAGWLNDPCAPMYDPTRDEYHIFYQFHPNHINWGNISWGHATSKDMVTWEDVGGWRNDEAVALGPTGYGNYNGLGIFSGTAQPVNLQGEEDGTLLIFYTSVQYLPTNWKIPYTPYTETQSLVMSHDGGMTWEEYENNPVIDATTETDPMYWNITGFRDPFFEPWPEMDNLLGASEPHYYAVFGSGIKGVGPRMPLWRAPARNLTDWTFLGALWEPEQNSSFASVLATGTNAFNFEVSGFYSVPDSRGNLHYYTTYGTEGGNVSFHQGQQWALWAEGTVTPRENGSAQFNQIAGGAADWGNGYAITQFQDTKNNRRIQWVWAREDFLGDDGLFSATQQGYQGSLTIPREIFVHEVDNVLNPNGTLNSGEAVLIQNTDGTYYATTQGRRPAPDVMEGLREGSEHRSHSGNKTYSSCSMLSDSSAASYELLATFSPSSSGPIGLTIAASPDGSERTHIFYNPSNSTILVDRSASSQIKEFGNGTVTGYFRPYFLAATNAEEAITMHVIVDGSLVEVFVNERFALSTRVYPSQTCSTGYGVYVGEGEGEMAGEAVVEKFEAWVGLKKAWPERPVDSSSELIWDTAEETNNYTWWSGN